MLILHVEGATHPNAPRLPKYIKSDVYFPGYLIEEDPRFSSVISDLVQKFIVDIGIPVIQRWEQCARSIWSLTQGADGRIPPPYALQPVQPEAIPRGSSTFVYNGRKSSTDPPCSLIEDDEEYKEDPITQSMVDIVNLIEQCDTYKARLDAMQSVLLTTEEALTESLAREEDLKAELNSALSINGAGSNVNIIRRQVGSPKGLASPPLPTSHRASPTSRNTAHISGIGSPTHHNRLPHFSPTSPTPASRYADAFVSPSRASPIGRRLFANLSSSSEHTWESNISAPTPPEIDALAAYYDFLNTHNLTHLRSTLDVIRRSIPISSWALKMEKAGVPLQHIDFVMVLMVTSGHCQKFELN